MLYEHWSDIVRRYDEQIAFWHPDCPGGLSFRELDQRAEKCARESSFFIAHGDDVDFLPTILAAWKSGKPVILVEGKEQKPKPIACDLPADTVLIKQTCGASGVERSLFFTAGQVLAEARRNIDGLGLHPGQRAVAAISLAHSYGFGCIVLPLLFAGVPVQVLESPLPVFVLRALDEGGAVFLPAVPAIWKMWWQTKITSHPNIALAVTAGVPLSLKLERAIFEECGLKLHNFYGTSETGALAFDHSDTPRTEETYLGELLGNVQVQIDEATILSACCRSIASGSDVLLEAEEFSRPFYRTQDLAILKNRNLYLKKCIGAAVNVAGRKVSPENIQKIICSLDGVSDAKVSAVMSQDFERYQEICVSITLADGAAEQSIKEALRSRLESWEMPRKWEFIKTPC